jgi:histidine ammonia-lyase
VSAASAASDAGAAGTVRVDGRSLDVEKVVRVARSGEAAVLDPEAERRMAESRAVVEACVASGDVRYGITTGFGKFSDVVISADDNAALQENLIMSHACGVGEPFPEEVVRAMALLRANALAVGYSGIRPSVVAALLAMLNSGVTPVVPEKGSLGASGDLAPLSHLALVLCGKGEAFYGGRRMSGSEALAAALLEPVVLSAKEGLALVNGTQAMTAVGSLAAHDARELAATADLACAMTSQALRGIVDAYDGRIHELRGQPGQEASAAALRALLAGSALTTRQGEARIQDAYALRCAPQVHGACRDAIGYALAAVEREINAVTDNPLILPRDLGSGFSSGADILSGGNFHGQPIALAMDFLGIAIAALANISERRVERLVNPALSNGLPAFLTAYGGLNSGFMIAQYAAASLVSENKVLAHPASVDSIPSSANQEDHVSMGTIAARKARSAIANAQAVVAIELLAACQAADLRAASMKREAREVLSPPAAAAYEAVRARVPRLEGDRVMYPDIEAARAIVADGSALAAARAALGQEGIL